MKEGIEQIKSARLEGDAGFVIDSLEYPNYILVPIAATERSPN